MLQEILLLSLGKCATEEVEHTEDCRCDPFQLGEGAESPSPKGDTSPSPCLYVPAESFLDLQM